MMVPKTPLERLLARRAIVDCPTMATPCWEWMGGRHDFGYGIGWLDGRRAYAHRIAYSLLVGPIPAGLQIDHLCRNPPCFNPDHLEAVTSRENTMRGENWSARRAAQTHCVNSHEFTNENTYARPNGTRACKECTRQRTRRYRAARRSRPWQIDEIRIAAA